MGNAEAQVIHAFWFGSPDSEMYGEDLDKWFKSSEAFDDACRAVMSGHYEPAASGALDHWADAVISGVALCLILDQYPRNAFRGTAASFVTDRKAMETSRRLIDGELDGGMIKVQREFVYMPFMHSEDLADQEYSVKLFEELGDANNLAFAIRHRDIVQWFGRFPHRNEILGRINTPEEIAFLTQPNSSF
jgi:uncharacterized protein (DUF924 family)